MELQLSPEELSELAGIVDAYSLELASEIQHTDNHEYRRKLKEEKQTVSSLLQKLAATTGKERV